MAIHGPFYFPISATSKLFRHSRNNTQPFQNWYGFSKQNQNPLKLCFPIPRQARRSRWAEADKRQDDEEESERTRVEAREDRTESAAWRNDAEKSWQQSTHLGIDIRVKGAVLFEFFDLKSIL